MKTDRRLRATINIGTDGPNQIIAAPSDGSHIEIDHLSFVVVASNNTVSIRDNTTDIFSNLNFPTNSSYVFDNPNNSENTIALEANSSFVIAMTHGASSIKGFVLYRIVGQ